MNYLTLTCDCCGCQEQQPNDLPWCSQIKTMEFISLPSDGCNVGKWKTDLCRDCRVALADARNEAYTKAWEKRAETGVEKITKRKKND